MKVKIFAIMALFLGCGHKSKTENPPGLIEQARSKAASYAQALDESYYVRCDTLAFRPYLTVAGYPQDLSGFEIDGKWSRDITAHPPCYPKESSGSISFDGMIAVLHHIWSTKDRSTLDRLIAYGNAHGWRIGEGEYANQRLLAPIVLEMKLKLSNLKKVGPDTPAGGLESIDALKGFRGHLLATYVWLQGRMNGAINDLENQALKALLAASPDDPMYLSLFHRFNGADQDQALDILLDEAKFPVTISRETGVFGWGSSPSSVYYLMTLAIIEGK